MEPIEHSIDADSESIIALATELKARRSSMLRVQPDAIQRRTIKALCKISESMKIAAPEAASDVGDYALEAVVECWTEGRLNTLIESENVTAVQSNQLSTHIIASNTPILTWTSVARALLVQSASIVRVPNSLDVHVSTALFHNNLQEIDAELAGLVERVYWPSSDQTTTRAAISESHRTLIYGSDDTIAKVKALGRQDEKLLTYGQKISIALIDYNCINSETASGIALDMAIFDQQGCLSPQVVFIIGEHKDAEVFGQMLATQLATIRHLFPKRTMESATRIRTAVEMSKLDQYFEHIVADDLAWAVLFGRAARMPIPNAPGCVCVCAVESVDRAVAIIKDRGLENNIQGCALAFKSDSDAAAARLRLEKMSVNYICEPGRLQRPPFDWHEDGYSPLTSLV